MNYKQAALEDLRNHEKRKDALLNIKDRISALQAQYEASKTTTFGSEPVSGGASQTEDRWINNIMERERLKVAYGATKRLVDIVERGLANLTTEQQAILMALATSPRKYDAEKIFASLNISERTFYREKDIALRNFTLSMYGVLEL